MQGDLIACLQGEISAKNFKEKFEAHRRVFREMMLNEVKSMMEDKELQDRFEETIADVIFVGHPKSDDQFFGGYKLLLNEMNQVLSV